ncbi:tetratricopeptide repeat protein [bacterium]|nr:tetratricopeptide repeat protein [bacterium]
MLRLLKPSKLLILLPLIIVLGLQSCAYYNTFYNAEQYYAEAQKLTRENQTETVSREEINLYSKSIEKSKKLLQRYADSKYRDDAQFLIAKSYYFKGDFLLAKRYFEDLARNFSSSPYTREVPLWIGRCLVKIGDLEMAHHEASRIINDKTDRGLEADALLLLGEIAVKQDSLELAEHYLEQVIDRSPDGFTKAQAQFQVGKMRENKFDYQAALEAYKSVARYKPSESLKVEAIIRQTNMLKALNRDADAVEMIQGMLISDKFVDIRGQLEVELGKLLRVMGKVDQAESKFKMIIEDYSRQEVAAEADFELGKLYLIDKLDYIAAREAFTDIKTQSSRSPFVVQGSQRKQQIERYLKFQLDHKNQLRQLAGLPPLVKDEPKNTAKGRGTRDSRSRGRTRRAEPGMPADVEVAPKVSKEETQVEAVEVTAEDSIRLQASIDENRYTLAEYMLFEFVRVDTTLEILKTLEAGSIDSSIKHRSAYMQYYALESVNGDEEAGQAALEHIQTSYPAYYKTIMIQTEDEEIVIDPDEERFRMILSLFENMRYAEASAQFLDLKEDTTITQTLRAKSCFNYAWLNDHFLYDRNAALEGYGFMIDNFPNYPLTETARGRISTLNMESPKPRPGPNEINPTEPVSDEAIEKSPDPSKAPKPREKKK